MMCMLYSVIHFVRSIKSYNNNKNETAIIIINIECSICFFNSFSFLVHSTPTFAFTLASWPRPWYFDHE